ncbi:MAG TPA: hypothetical protein VFB29_10845 [Pseudolabrys sp.]|nr:hypothetical protein [Pseudolabrys sp.]
MDIAALTIVFLVLDALLWYQRPNPHLWLFGSLFLGGLWGAGFLWLITRRK